MRLSGVCKALGGVEVGSELAQAVGGAVGGWAGKCVGQRMGWGMVRRGAKRWARGWARGGSGSGRQGGARWQSPRSRRRSEEERSPQQLGECEELLAPPQHGRQLCVERGGRVGTAFTISASTSTASSTSSTTASTATCEARSILTRSALALTRRLLKAIHQMGRVVHMHQPSVDPETLWPKRLLKKVRRGDVRGEAGGWELIAVSTAQEQAPPWGGRVEVRRLPWSGLHTGPASMVGGRRVAPVPAGQGTHRVRTVEGVFILQGHELLPQRLDLALGALLQFRQRGARP